MDIKNKKHSTRNNGKKQKNRKKGINRGKFGSVRNIQGKVYVDFRYLGERVRESSELPWTPENVDIVREQLNRMHASIQLGTFRFAEVFPRSSKKKYFSDKEIRTLKLAKNPDDVQCKEYIPQWYMELRDQGDVQPSTLSYYKMIIDRYLEPFFGPLTFGELGNPAFKKFHVWCKKQKYRSKIVSNKSVNKFMVLFKRIVNDASDEYGWGNTYNPFFKYKKLKERKTEYMIQPFTLNEQQKIIENLPDFWKPFFLFAFLTGLRQSEQIALKPIDIDWEQNIIYIRRAISRNEFRYPVEAKTKNDSSERILYLNPQMIKVLEQQKVTCEQFKSEYFFCSEIGTRIDPSNLRKNIWIPTLSKAGVTYRDMRQTRHSFATIAMSCGENPLWIAQFLGHQNTDMVIRVYSKYVGNILGKSDGAQFYKNYSSII